MTEVVKTVVDNYRRAVRERDWPAQTGILLALIRMLVWPTSLKDQAQATAEEILRINDDDR